MRTRTRRLWQVVSMLLMLVTLAAVLPLAGSAQSNRVAAKACAGGRHADQVREDGSRFRNAGECVKYVASGGVLDRDGDSDGAPDSRDNCTGLANPGQTDTDLDGAGDACDSTPNGDSDGDGIDNAVDLTPNGDDDGDGIDNSTDGCAAGDDTIDTDSDGTADACDSTPKGTATAMALPIRPTTVRILPTPPRKIPTAMVPATHATWMTTMTVCGMWMRSTDI